MKHVYTKKGIVDMVKLLGPHFENLGHSIELLELNCTSKMVRFLSMIYYSKQEYILEVEIPTDKWEVFHPNSMFDTLYRKVCK